MAAPELPVKVYCTVIPEGVILPIIDDDGSDAPTTLKVSLVLTPFIGDDSVTGPVALDLKQWVSLLSNETRHAASSNGASEDPVKYGFSLYLCKSAGTFVAQLIGQAFDRRLVDGAAAPAKAQALWEDIFTPAATLGDTGFDALYRALDADRSLQVQSDRKTRFHGRQIDLRHGWTYDSKVTLTAMTTMRTQTVFQHYKAQVVRENLAGNSPNIADVDSSLLSDALGRFRDASDTVRRDYADAFAYDHPLADAFGKATGLAGVVGPHTETQTLQEQINRRVVYRASRRINPNIAAPPELEHPVKVTRQRVLDARRYFDPATAGAFDSQPIAQLKTGSIAQLKSEVGRYYHANQYERRPNLTPQNPGDALRGDEDDARRKLFGINAYPTLAKFLRLIFDVEVTIDPQTFKDQLDYEHDHDHDVDRWHGCLAAMLSTSPDGVPDPAQYHYYPPKTAFTYQEVHKKTHEGKPVIERSFEPRSMYPTGDQQAAQDLIPIRHGFADLRSRLWAIEDPGLPGNEGARFELRVVDVGGIVAHTSQFGSDVERARSGVMASSTSVKLPELRNRGIELIDRGALQDAIASLAGAQARATTTNPTDTPLFAEDLVAGFRVDVEHGWPVDLEGRVLDEQDALVSWGTVTGRRVTFPYINKACNCPPDGHPFPDFRERDDGVIAMGGKLQALPTDHKDDTPDFQQVVTGRLFAWTGENLAVPADQRSGNQTQEQGTILHPETDLAVDVRLSLSEERPTAALRIGDFYRIVLRASYKNGGGRKFDAEGRRYEKFALGDPDKPVPTRLRYTIPEEVQAPVVLVLPKDPIVSQPARQDLVHGKPDIVVVSHATGNDPRIVACRVLLPPAIQPDAAEQQGLFDSSYDPIPAGAFPDLNKDAKSGALPQAYASGIFTAPPPGTQGGGVAVVFQQAPPHDTQKPYYPDPDARNLGMAFVRDGVVPNGFSDPELAPEFHFWTDDQGPLAAEPVLLHVEASDSSAGGTLETSMRSISLVDPGNGRSTPARQIDIRLAPAEEVGLLLWCYPDWVPAVTGRLHVQYYASAVSSLTPDSIAAQPKVVQQELLGLQSQLQAAVPPADDLEKKWRNLAGRQPLSPLSTRTELRLVHAVQRPLAVPQFARIDASRPSFNAVEIVVADNSKPADNTGPQATNKKDPWQDFVNAQTNPAAGQTAHPDPMTWQSQPNATVAFFAGNVTFDRASTGTLRCEAAWRDPDDAKSIRKVRDGFSFDPPIVVQSLFTIPSIPRDAGDKDKLDLLHDERGALRRLSYTFDGRAHLLRLRLIATSRFTSYFDTSEPNAFDVSSRPQSALRGGLSCIVGSDDVWVKSTKQPAIPVLDRIERRFKETEIVRNGKHIIVEKTVTTRTWLQPQSWHDTGEGELLAIICLPDDLFDPAAGMCGADGQLAKATHHLDPGELARSSALRRDNRDDLFPPGVKKQVENVITGWGTDPMTDSGVLTYAIPPSAFAGYVAKGQCATFTFTMPLDPLLMENNSPPTTSPPSTVTTTVSFVAFEPVFDKITGGWYVDLDFDPGPVDSPFLRLCLARYQPQAASPLLEFSTNTTVDPVQIPPRRTVTVEPHIASDPDGQSFVIVLVDGPGYSQRAIHFDNAAHNDLRYLTDTPRLSFRLLRLIGGDPDKSRAAVQTFAPDHKPIEALHASPITHEGVMRWVCRLDLPRRAKPTDYVLKVEESELYPSDTGDKHDSVPRSFSCDIWLGASGKAI